MACKRFVDSQFILVLVLLWSINSNIVSWATTTTGDITTADTTTATRSILITSLLASTKTVAPETTTAEKSTTKSTPTTAAPTTSSSSTITRTSSTSTTPSKKVTISSLPTTAPIVPSTFSPSTITDDRTRDGTTTNNQLVGAHGAWLPPLLAILFGCTGIGLSVYLLRSKAVRDKILSEIKEMELAAEDSETTTSAMVEHEYPAASSPKKQQANSSPPSSGGGGGQHGGQQKNVVNRNQLRQTAAQPNFEPSFPSVPIPRNMDAVAEFNAHKHGSSKPVKKLLSKNLNKLPLVGKINPSSIGAGIVKHHVKPKIHKVQFTNMNQMTRKHGAVAADL